MMKKAVLSIIVALIILVGIIVLLYRPTEINAPYLTYRNLHRFTLSRVVCTDTVTYLEMATPFDPYFLKLDTGLYLVGKTTGKHYRMWEADRAWECCQKLGAESKIGQTSLRLCFDPLSRQDTQFDFYSPTVKQTPLLENVCLTKWTEIEQKIRRSVSADSLYRDGNIICRIKGRVVGDQRINGLELHAYTWSDEDWYTLNLPLQNREFDYTLYEDAPRPLGISGRLEKSQTAHLPFLAENGTINIEYHLIENRNYIAIGPSVAASSRIEGGELNSGVQPYLQQLDSMHKRIDRVEEEIEVLKAAKGYYTPVGQQIKDMLKKTNGTDEWRKWLHKSMDLPDQEQMTPAGIALKQKLQEAEKAVPKWEEEYLRKNPTHYGFFKVYSDLYELTHWTCGPIFHIEVDDYIRLAKEVYLPQFPDSPFLGKMEHLLHKLDSMRQVNSLFFR